jgi:hypothetical protein
MNTLTKRVLLLLVTPLLFLPAACSDKPNDTGVSSSGPSPTASPTTAASPITAASPATSAPARPVVADSTAQGVTFTASPNPIKVCDGSGYGITTLNWKAPGVGVVEVHVNAPDGAMPARGGAEGSVSTHKWVGDGTVFYLQDVTGGAKPSAANTIGTLTVNVTTTGCP